jgi:hypothetical protein
MLEQLKSANWKKQEVTTVAKQEAYFTHDGIDCHVYLSRYADTEHVCGGKWNLQVRVGGMANYGVSVCGIVDTEEMGMEHAARMIPHLIAAHRACKGE